MNGVYIRQLSQDDLADRLMPVLTSAGLSADLPTVRRLVPLVQERLKTLNDVVALVDFFFTDEVQPDPADLIPRKMTAAEALASLKAARSALAALPDFDEGTIEAALRGLADELGLKAGSLFTPIRVAVTGKRVAPPLFGTLSVLGRDRTLARIDQAISLLSQLVNER
jgi:glutamyl-tRNA synthetase